MKTELTPASIELPGTPQSPLIKVVIVEDDSSVRSILREWIDATPGFECSHDYADTESALVDLPSRAPNVALLDINLPGLSGIDCVKRLKPLLPETQFVMLTVYEDSNHIFDALAAGASGYLLKRTPRESLITALRDVFVGGSPMSSNIARRVVQSFQQSRPKGNPADALSPREAEVLALLARGYLYKEISETIGISLPTVNTYTRRIYEKLHVHSRAQAVALWSAPAKRPTA